MLYFNKNSKNMAVNAGIIFDSENEIQNDIYLNFASKSNINVTIYDNLTEMKNDISGAKIECGYMVEDLEQLIDKGKADKVGEVYVSPASTATGFINELFYASVLKAVSPYIAADYLQSVGIDITVSQVYEEVKAYYDKDIFMKVNYVNTYGEQEETFLSPTLIDESHVVHGVIAFYCFLFIYFITAGLLDDNKTGIYLKLSKQNIIINNNATSLGVFISALFPALCGLTFIFFFKPYLLGGFLSEVIYIKAYVFCLTILSYIVILFIKNSEWLYSNFAIIAIAVLAFGSVFINLIELNSFLGNISLCFFSTHYILGILNGDNTIFLITALLMIFSAVITYLKLSSFFLKRGK